MTTTGGRIDGMTLRDYFAAQAMKGLVSDSACFAAIIQRANMDFKTPAAGPDQVNAVLAANAYGMADAMIKESGR